MFYCVNTHSQSLQWSQRLDTSLTYAFLGVYVRFVFPLKRREKWKFHRLILHLTPHFLISPSCFQSLICYFCAAEFYIPSIFQSIPQSWHRSLSLSVIFLSTHTFTVYLRTLKRTVITGSGKEWVLLFCFFAEFVFEQKLICHQITVRGSRRRRQEVKWVCAWSEG